jgi:hypothetical protein
MIQGQLLRVEGWQQTTDDYYTPPWVFERLGLEFDIDVAAPPGGVPWIPAKKYFTQADDGLAQEWEGLAWCNPPYSNGEPWVRRMVAHNRGVLLMPLGNTNWVDDLWASGVPSVLLPNHMKFIRPNQREQEILYRTCLWAFGDECVEALHNLGTVRVRGENP